MTGSSGFFSLHLLDFRLPKQHKDEREESVCEPTGRSGHEAMEVKRSIAKVASIISEDNNGTSPSSTVYGKVPKMLETCSSKKYDFLSLSL